MHELASRWLNPFDGHLMSLEELIVWLLACYGITFLLCSSRILATPRTWLVTRSSAVAELLACYFCTGFWVSLTTALWLLQTPVWGVLYGFAGATSCYVLDAVVRRLEAGEADEFDERPAAD